MSSASHPANHALVTMTATAAQTITTCAPVVITEHLDFAELDRLESQALDVQRELLILLSHISQTRTRRAEFAGY